jgi:CopG-like RHH_1 or ribbon-helix-helix domain, RHH_5
MARLWRVQAPDHLADAVRRLALAEGRSDSNMITKLIGEAISARNAADNQVDRLVLAIRTVAKVPS